MSESVKVRVHPSLPDEIKNNQKVCVHPSLQFQLAELLTVKDVDITESEMTERTLSYIAETFCRIQFKDDAETQAFLSKLKKNVSDVNLSVAVFAALREIHEYLLTIPKLEKCR